MTVSIIDVIAVAFIVFFAAVGIKKGLFRVILNLMTYVVAVVASRLLATPVSGFLYEKFFHLRILTRLEEIVPNSGDILTAIKTALPVQVVRIADYFKLFPDANALATFDSAVNAEKIETNFVMPIVQKILLIVITLVLFFVLVSVLKLIVNALDKRFFKRKKKGVVSGLNRVLGMILGIIKALIPTAIICEALNLIAPVLDVGLLTEAVSKSYICSFLA